MLIKDIKKCKEFIAGDNSILRELLHPDNDKGNLELKYSLAHAVVKPGDVTSLHLMTTSEVYYVLQGKGLMYVGNEKKEVKEGQVIYIPPNSPQRIRNTGNQDLVFLCIVDPAWKKENEDILE